MADTPTMTAGQSKSVVSGNSYRLLGSVTRLFNLTTLQRQFVALKGFRSSPIADIVVHPRKYLEIVQRLVGMGVDIGQCLCLIHQCRSQRR